jgi:amino acid adenylation domain-containing protein
MPQNNAEGFRLSPQQRYLWSVQQISASYPYQVLARISIVGELRTDILRRALADVVRTHEILRTTFQRPPGIKIPFQVISQEAQFSWEFTDRSNLSLVQPFDLDRGPLLRASLCRSASEHHVLLISLPAVCADPVTVSNLMKEIAEAYGMISEGAELAHEPMQYADFAEWHNELLEAPDERAHAGSNYWQELMAGADSSLLLPLEKRTTDEKTFQAEAVAIAFDSTCVANVERLARECRTSIEIVLFAFWQALIWRLTNRSSFVIFNLCDGRTVEDLGSAFGPYAKYLPVAYRGEDLSLAAQLEAAQTAVSQADEWQEYFDPGNFFEAAKDSVAFDFSEEVSATAGTGLELTLTEQQVCTGPFKLKLSCFRTNDSIRGELFYNSRSFDREVINHYAGYFTRLVAQGRAALPIGTIDIVTDGERQRLLVDINQTASEFAAAKWIHSLFEEQVERTPQASALVDGDRQITYAELNADANRLAHLLHRKGIAPNMRVGICIKRSAETIVAMVGILKAGGAYVPLNPDHPPARLLLQLAESNASVLITNGVAPVEPIDFAGEIIDLERDRALLIEEFESNPPAIGPTANLAYIIYTSGSSGVPKGVAVSHQSLLNYTQFILRRLRVQEPLNFATVSTITADLGNTCIFPALVSGGCLHLIGYDVAMEGTLFSEYLAKHPVDVLKIVPSHFSALLAAAGQENICPRKFLIFGGEALTSELVSRVSEAALSCEIINHYGPTETTVGSLTFALKPHELSTHSATVPIGQPIDNTRVYILDQHLHVTPTGVAGELYIGGAGVALGYLNEPVETAARFVPNPFSDEPGERLYRTGDLARYLLDGNIEFLGRIDHQVKVRGFRVELGEIESLLLKYREVRQAVVIAAAGTTDNQRLIAYVVATGIKPPSVDELRTFLGQHLPDYMIPSSFVFLKSMPLTLNGKINHAALPAPDEARPELERRFVAPRTPIEKELADIWATFLKLREVGIHDNFFELGGHSLLATQVVSRMRKTFNCEVLLRSLFESPTIAGLAEQMSSSLTTDTERLLAEIEQLSDAQVASILEAEQT